MRYSERLGLITDEQLQAALTKHSLGSLRSTAKIDGGLFGQNLFVTSSAGAFVLRGVPHYDWQFPTEKFFAELLSENGIPTPTPYIYDPDLDIFGWEYVIMPRLSGVNISSKLDDKFTDDERIEIAKAQAKMLNKIQQYKFDHFGRFDIVSKEIRSEFTSVFEDISTRTINQLTLANQHNSINTSADDIEWVQILLKEAAVYFKPDYQPTVVLQDYKFENMLVKKAGADFEVSAVFDLMEAYVGHGEADLSRMYCMYTDAKRQDLASVYVETWLDLQSEIDRKAFESRFKVFLILDRSIVWEFRQRNPDTARQGFREFINSYQKV